MAFKELFEFHKFKTFCANFVGIDKRILLANTKNATVCSRKCKISFHDILHNRKTLINIFRYINDDGMCIQNVHIIDVFKVDHDIIEAESTCGCIIETKPIDADTVTKST